MGNLEIALHLGHAAFGKGSFYHIVHGAEGVEGVQSRTTYDVVVFEKPIDDEKVHVSQHRIFAQASYKP